MSARVVTPAWVMRDCAALFARSCVVYDRFYRALDLNRTCWAAMWEASVTPPRPRTGIVMRFVPALPV